MKIIDAVSEKALQRYLDTKQHYINYYLSYSAKSLDIDFVNEVANFRQAVAYALETNRQDALTTFWNNIKDFLMDGGFWLIFREWGEAILKLIEGTKNTETQAWLWADLGWLSMERRDFLDAQKRFLQARHKFNRIGNPFGECALERYLGVLAYRMGNLDEATSQYMKAENLAVIHNYEGMMAEIANLQGSLARKKGKFNEARHQYQKSIRALKSINDRWRLTAVLRNMARLEFQAGNFVASREVFSEAIELCKQLGRKDMLYGCYLRLAEVERELGNLKEAMELCSRASNGFEELGLDHDLADAKQFLTRLSQERALDVTKLGNAKSRN
jgi:tetratricopeptide (TPR) repeat protein